MNKATPVEKKLSKESTKVAQDDPLKLFAAFLKVYLISLTKNIHTIHKDLEYKN